MIYEKETRIFGIRAVSAGGKRSLVGRAATFGKFSHDLGGFREVIKPGCFTNALKRGDETIFTMNHDPNLIMGRTRNGTLRLRQSDQGLEFSADLPDTQAAKDLWTLVAGGTISECSFSFRCDKDSWPSCADLLSTFGGIDMDSLPAGVPIRMLEDLTLFDASAVAQPAYGGGVTHVGADISSLPVDPAATRPHMEGVSISQYALAEARARGGSSRPLSEDEARMVRARARALRIRLDDEENG